MTRADGAGAPSQDTDPVSYRSARRALRPALALALGFSALVNVLMLTGSVYMLQVYDRVLSSGSVPTLVGLFAIVVVLYGFLGLYDFLRARILSRSAMRLDALLGASAFAGWMRSGLPGGGRGREEAQALRDLGTLRGFLMGPSVTALLDLPFVPLYLGLLFILHPLLGWLTVAGAAIGAMLALATRLLTAGVSSRAGASEAAERDIVEAARRSAETVTAMGLERALVRRWSEAHDRTLRTQQAGSDPSEALAAGSRAFRMLLQSAILTLGAWLVLAGEISSGMIIASSILSGRSLGPVDQITGQWRQLGQALEAHRRLMRAELGEPAAPRLDLPEPMGQLDVQGLARLAPARPGAHPAAPRPRILSDVSFRLEPGDAMAVLGSSASGKSTLARMLVGALRPDMGEVRLDGATLDQWEAARRGRFLGYLPQQIEFLPATIRDTIARFDPKPSAAEVIAAARLAGVHDMILRLPEGYDTMLGAPSRPAPLSGGQLQRVALARAVYGSPALVVLDEPNSNLDAAGERALEDAIRSLRAAGSTVVVMAHRTSILGAVNKILMLEAGRPLIFGDKDEIMDRTGLGGLLGEPLKAAPKATPPFGPSVGPLVGDPSESPIGAPVRMPPMGSGRTVFKDLGAILRGTLEMPPPVAAPARDRAPAKDPASDELPPLPLPLRNRVIGTRRTLGPRPYHGPAAWTALDPAPAPLPYSVPGNASEKKRA